MARLRDMKKEEMFGGTRGAKPSEEPPPPDYKDLQREIDGLDKEIDELRSQYELYFMGVERLEPVAQRDLIKSQLRRWKETPIKNTAIKFKVQQLKARLVSLENYWGRINKQKEDGTYKRDVERVKRREKERLEKEAKDKKKKADDQALANAPSIPPTQLAAAGRSSTDGKPINTADLQAGRSAAVTGGKPGTTQQRGAPPGKDDMTRPSATSAEDLTESKLRKLYQTYVGARKRCNEPVDLRYEDMAAALRKQVPKLMQQTGAKAVEFKVVIRGGKAVLKALPKH